MIMKRLCIIILFISLMSFSLRAKTDVTPSTTFRIEKLSTPTIKIGNRTLRQGDVFKAADEIQWSEPDQSILVRNTSSSELVRFSRRISEKKGRLRSLLELYKQINMGSTRGIYNHVTLEKSPEATRFPERRIALVVGNQNYQYLAPLKNAQKDAEDVASTLQNLGFDLIELYETTYSELMAGVNKFAGLARDYDVALVYYAGHGIQEEHTNYLVPVDNMLERQADLRDCVSCNQIVQKVEDSRCPSKIFYFDACRDRKTSWSRSVLNGLSAMEGDAGTVIVFATQSGKVASDGDRDDNSPFAKMLIKNMQVPKLSFPEMMSALVRDTYNATGFTQYPVKVGDLITEFRFNPYGTIQTAAEGDSPFRTEIFKAARALDNDKKYSESLATYLKEPDNPWCQVNIGYFYFDGKGVPVDKEKAKEWFLKAAAQSEGKGMRGVGNYYFDKHDYTQAIEWYKKAAEAGDIDMYSKVGSMYEEGIGVPKDYRKAIEWYQNGIRHDDASSMATLGLVYYLGHGVKQNYKKAMEWYSKAVEKDNALGMYFMGYAFYEGMAVPQDYAKALELYTKSAEGGQLNAFSDVARAYLKGEGTPKDNEKAYEWAKKGADEGDPESMFLIGWMYDTGSAYFNKNENLAKQWYTKAIENGHVYSKVCLANLLTYNEEENPEDYVRALQLYREAAAKNDSEAMLNVGIFHYLGLGGVSKNPKEAAKWFIKAAEGGNVQAMYNLGYYYEKLDTPGLDSAAAFKWMEKAAKGGHIDGMRLLGIKYYNGEGVPVDRVAAKEWVKKSAEAGSQTAKELLDEWSQK